MLLLPFMVASPCAGEARAALLEGGAERPLVVQLSSEACARIPRRSRVTEPSDTEHEREPRERARQVRGSRAEGAQLYPMNSAVHVRNGIVRNPRQNKLV